MSPEVYTLKNAHIEGNNNNNNNNDSNNKMMVDGKLADAWSLGVCIVGMLTGVELYDIPYFNKDNTDKRFFYLWKLQSVTKILESWNLKNGIFSDLCLKLVNSFLRQQNKRKSLQNVIDNPCFGF